ncbi:hypothetical protein DW940_09685 [Bacteroides uniformis]|jgi:hypothetical protein|uniref:Uncharacterized protein n=1 Tax=Bacteroides uniformis TaxID=820 RepID=A0A396CPB4_BACUN|nr:hypothetical protein DXC80_00670 [Bacteroides uniformis]RGL37078.1 hypothetical protein DXC68_03330 [Bacteroides uniformis]RGN72474.1 hypothetical protein DXB48_11490 [Bacteroides uniformis]RGX67486.1 hypothetical protein DXA73_03030 [Bacteroides uniformis]RHA32117.1 hypothetical protein DW940_09685 [Bacteroides uniformis]
MPERIRTSPPKCLYKKAMKRNRTENLKKQIKKSPQAIADFKKMSTFATAKQKRVSPIRPAPFESSRA